MSGDDARILKSGLPLRWNMAYVLGLEPLEETPIVHSRSRGRPPRVPESGWGVDFGVQRRLMEAVGRRPLGFQARPDRDSAIANVSTIPLPFVVQSLK